MKKGLLIILSGPSGVGKGTVRAEFMKRKDLRLWFSVSMTTRKPRPGEVDGKDYFFVTDEQFKKSIEAGDLLEHNNFVTHYYGTPKNKVEEMRSKGYNVLLEIDVNGASQVMSKYDDDDLVSVFLLPPSIEELEKRIRGRCTENEETIKNRLAQSRREMAQAVHYQHNVKNITIAQCSDQIAEILLKKMNEAA